MDKFGKVAVLMGGDSNERAISLLSGDAIFHALKRLGINAETFDPSGRNIEDIKSYDRVYIALHGRGGEDGSIQAFPLVSTINPYRKEVYSVRR